MATSPAHLSFVPWVRQGTAAAIAVQDTLGSDLRGEEGRLVLRKLTGSVTWLARLTPITAQSLLYYGTYAARSDKNAVYPGGDAYNHQVGILQNHAGQRFRIEMPRPTHSATSDHDVVELFR